MAKPYEQISLSERIELYRMYKEGRSMRAIASSLGRSPSTVSRELRRNSHPTKVWSEGYQPLRAQALKERARALHHLSRVDLPVYLPSFAAEGLLASVTAEA